MGWLAKVIIVIIVKIANLTCQGLLIIVAISLANRPGLAKDC